MRAALRSTLFALIALVSISVSVPASVRAQEGVAERELIDIVVFNVDALLLIAAATTAIGNFYYCGHDRAPSTAWITTGYVFGTLNMLAGAVLIGFFHTRPAHVGVGSAQIVLGGVALSSAIWGLVLHKREQRRKSLQRHALSLVPLVSPTRSGALFLGVGLRWRTF